MLLLLVGCGPIPQTRQEFVTAAKQKQTGVGNESFVVDRGFDSIVAVLEDRAKECLNQTVDRSSALTHEAAADYYRAALDRRGSGQAELTVQVDRTPRGILKQPEGGLYVLAEDLAGTEDGKTKIDLYYPTIGFGEMVKSVREWTQGKSTACPDLK